MNRAQREAIARYAAEPDLDEAAGARLQLALDGCAPDTEREAVFDPARQAARVDRLRRENLRTIADELAIHAHIKRSQLSEVRCPQCRVIGWLKRVPGGYRCRSCDVLSTDASVATQATTRYSVQPRLNARDIVTLDHNAHQAER